MNSDAMEMSHSAQSVAETLNIGRSTLNKYSRSLEESGYIFIKDDRGNRAYTEHDIVALRYFKSLLDKGIAYDRAIQGTSSKYSRMAAESFSIARGDTNSEENRVTKGNFSDSAAILDEVATLRSEVSQLIEMNRELFMRLDQRDQEIRQLSEMVNSQKALATAREDNREEREQQRDEKLTQILRELHEAKQQASKPVWKRLFNK